MGTLGGLRVEATGFELFFFGLLWSGNSARHIDRSTGAAKKCQEPNRGRPCHCRPLRIYRLAFIVYGFWFMVLNFGELLTKNEKL